MFIRALYNYEPGLVKVIQDAVVCTQDVLRTVCYALLGIAPLSLVVIPPPTRLEPYNVIVPCVIPRWYVDHVPRWLQAAFYTLLGCDLQITATNHNRFEVRDEQNGLILIAIIRASRCMRGLEAGFVRVGNMLMHAKDDVLQEQPLWVLSSVA